MSTFQPCPGVIQAVLGYSVESSRMCNVLHFHWSALLPEQSMDGLMTQLSAWYSTSLRSVLASNVALTGIQLAYLGDVNGRVMQWQPITTLYGTQTTPTSSANVSLAIRMGTGRRGRGQHGRLFSPPLPTGFVSGSIVNSTLVDALVNCVSELLDPEVIFAHNLCVLSRWSNKTLRPEGVPFNVVDVTADNVVDSQRRRLPGRGQ